MSSKLQPARQPNLFILGAAKSGTTSLYHYLAQHPDVFMCPGKEPNFFTEGYQTVGNPIDYYRLFDGVRNEPVIGEASHSYLTNPSTASVLAALYPRARYIVVLRDPVDRAFSLYHAMRRTGHESVGTFEKALEVEEERWNSDAFRKKCTHYFYNFMYFRSGLFGEQLQRYLGLFERSQILVLSFDELTTQPAKVMRQVYGFLQIDDTFVPKFEVYNEGGTTNRYPRLHVWMKHRLKEKPGRHWLYAVVKRLLNPSAKEAPPPMSPGTRARLAERYRADQKLLKDLTSVSVLKDRGAS